VVTDLETLFTATVARHFSDARTADHVVDTGYVRIACRLGELDKLFGVPPRAR
jgi:hypothetical protein